MKAVCDITIEFEDSDKVKKVMKSIEVDNLEYAKSKINGKKLETHIEGKSVSSLLHTLDDYLACVSVAEKIVDKS